MFRAAHGIFRVVSQSLSGSLNTATRCSPAVGFYLAPLWWGAWEAHPLGWAPKEQDLAPCCEKGAWQLREGGHLLTWMSYPSLQCLKISLQKIKIIINKDNNIYWAKECWRLELGKQDIGAQQSPGLSRHMLLKDISSSFEILFPHGGERQGVLPKNKSFSVRGVLNGFGFPCEVTVWHTSFLCGIKDQLFS